MEESICTGNSQKFCKWNYLACCNMLKDLSLESRNKQTRAQFGLLMAFLTIKFFHNFENRPYTFEKLNFHAIVAFR